MTEGRLKGRRVAIGVCGGIAAYKAIECIRLLTEAEAEVRVLMTPEATRFVTPLTFEALSDNPVAADWLAPQGGGESHIRLAEWADVIAIVPATANTMAKLALGRPLRGRDYGDDTTVKVPGEIDAQRARRILEELRRRIGEAFRPQLELDYIERLLKDY